MKVGAKTGGAEDDGKRLKTCQSGDDVEEGRRKSEAARRRGLRARLDSLRVAGSGGGEGAGGQGRRRGRERPLLQVLREEWTEEGGEGGGKSEMEGAEEAEGREQPGTGEEGTIGALEAAEGRLKKVTAKIFPLGDPEAAGGGAGFRGLSLSQQCARALLLRYQVQRQHLKLYVNHLVRAREEVFGPLRREEREGREGRWEGDARLREMERSRLVRLAHAYAERLKGVAEEQGGVEGRGEGAGEDVGEGGGDRDGGCGQSVPSLPVRRRKKRFFPPPPPPSPPSSSVLLPPPATAPFPPPPSLPARVLHAWLRAHWTHPYPSHAQALALAARCRLSSAEKVDTFMMNQRQRTWLPQTKRAYAEAKEARSARPLLALVREVEGGEGEEDGEGDVCKRALERMVAEEGARGEAARGEGGEKEVDGSELVWL